jgi:hypothetical protein
LLTVAASSNTSISYWLTMTWALKNQCQYNISHASKPYGLMQAFRRPLKRVMSLPFTIT